MANFVQKVYGSLTAALLFFVISSPFVYRLVDQIVGSIVSAIAPQFTSLFKIAEAGCPTNYGLLVHSVVFGIVVYFLMG